MRAELAKIDKVRDTFFGVVERFGTKPSFKGYPTQTVLLTDVKDCNGNIVTDHIWFIKGKSFDSVKPGDVIKFNARVGQYVKGYKGHRWELQIDNPIELDYRLERPTQLQVIDCCVLIKHICVCDFCDKILVAREEKLTRNYLIENGISGDTWVDRDYICEDCR